MVDGMEYGYGLQCILCYVHVYETLVSLRCSRTESVVVSKCMLRHAVNEDLVLNAWKIREGLRNFVLG